MSRGERPTFFRGAELARLAVLGGIMIAGWAAVLWSGDHKPPDSSPPRPASPAPPLPPPDDSPALRGIQDRAGMTTRDNAAYAELLERVRGTPYDELAKASRRDVVFAQLVGNPDRYRGIPIHVEGTALRVIRQDVEGSALFPDGVYYEAYVVTPDSIDNPWVLAFEAIPPGLPIGDGPRERVSFDGYFLKLWAYEAGVPRDANNVPMPDKRFRVAPLLVGRFPPAAAGTPPPARRPAAEFPWLPLLVVALTVYFAIRLVMQFQRMSRPRRATSRSGPVVDQIEPERLSAWIEGRTGDELQEEAPSPNGRAGWEGEDNPEGPHPPDGLRGI